MLIQVIDHNPTNHPISEDNFRQLFPQVSFPVYLTPASVEGTGFGLYEYTVSPTPDRYEKVIEVMPKLNTAGVWYQAWEIAAMSEEEKNETDQRQADNVRLKRTRLLADCDWTQLPDSAVDAAAWAVYRQELRDITLQPKFPWDIIWPIEP